MRCWCFVRAILFSSAALTGCGGHSLDVGSNDAGTPVPQDSEPALLPLGPSLDASGVTEQVWTGHLVDQQFPDGSSALTLSLDFAPGGQVTGTLLLGDGALLKPATNPDVGYPPGNQGTITLVEGFPYTILDASWSGIHLNFQISEYEVWAQWCALQTAYLFAKGNDAGPDPAPDIYRCFPSDARFEFEPTGCNLWNPADAALSPIACGKLRMCGAVGPPGACQCSATGCFAMSPASPGPSIALNIVGTKADGTMSGDFGNYEVQFVRSQ